MAHTRRTLKLTDSWDITLNNSGGIALLSGAEATAQAVANECRLFTKDAYFQQDRGTPYFVITLGQKPGGGSVLRSYLRKAALLVDDVKKVTAVEIESLDPATRKLGGEIQVTTTGDESVNVYF